MFSDTRTYTYRSSEVAYIAASVFFVMQIFTADPEDEHHLYLI